MPGRYTDRIRPVDVATAEGLILTAGGLGGFILPVIFGILETRFGFSVAFVFVGITSIVFALIGLAARQPLHFEQKD
jgi:nitrate/nitrite transporter NarK